MLCKATYIKKANLIKVTSNEVVYLLKPVLGLEPIKTIGSMTHAGLELCDLSSPGIENRGIPRVIGRVA